MAAVGVLLCENDLYHVQWFKAVLAFFVSLLLDLTVDTGNLFQRFFAPVCVVRSDGYSSGYSDGGGGQDRGDNMVCDLADSNDEEDDNNVVCDLANVEEGEDVEVGSLSEAQQPVLHPTGSDRWKQGKNSSAPIGLEAAIALAKAKKTGDLASKASPEEVIDLLSGDEGEEERWDPPPTSQAVEVSSAKPQLNGLANGEKAGNMGVTAMATEDAVRPASGSQKLEEEEEGQGGPPSLPQTVEVVTAVTQLNGPANEDKAGNASEAAVATEDVVSPASGSQKRGEEGEEGQVGPPLLAQTVEVVTAVSR